MAGTINCYNCNGLVSDYLDQCPHCLCNPRAYDCIFCGSKKVKKGELLLRPYDCQNSNMRYHLACIKNRGIFKLDCLACGSPVDLSPVIWGDSIRYEFDRSWHDKCSKCGHGHSLVPCSYCTLPALLEDATKIRGGSQNGIWIYWHKECFSLDPNSENLKRLSEQKEAAIASAKQQSESACFIAGAVYGSQCAPEVLAFRAFRDRRLATTQWGRLAISAYNQYSPRVARIIAKNSFLRVTARANLDLLVKIIKVD